MKKIPLAESDKQALCDDEDHGKLSRYSWYEHSDGYVVTNAPKERGGGKIYMHRLVMGIRSNEVQVDHDDRNKLNNQKKNLKPGTQQQNLSNREGYKPVGKANYAKAACMACKEKPPQYRVLWNGGKNESWFCPECWPGWFSENWQKVNYYDQIGEGGIPKRYRIKRTVKEETVKKDEGIEKNWSVDIVEKSEERQIVYGVVLRVGQVDSQGDIITNEAEILEAAHNYMIKSRRADWQHEKTLGYEKAIAVESYIAPCDFEINGHQIKKSDWIVGMKVFDPEMWQAIKKGEIGAFSIKGMGKRKPVESPT